MLEFKYIKLVSCFIMGMLYCLALTFFPSSLYQNFATISFVLFLLLLFLHNIHTYRQQIEQTPLYFLSQIALLNLGIGFATVAFKTPNSFFWVTDSLSTHLPESIKFLNFYNGDHSVKELGVLPGTTTHALTGFIFKILGINTFATILTQLIFKIITIIAIYNICLILWNNGVALIAMQIYGFCPTVFFYTLVHYKESAVQAMVALIILCFLKIFIAKKYLYFFVLALISYLLLRERYYLPSLFFSTFLLFIFSSFFSRTLKNYVMLFLFIVVAFAISYKLNTQYFNSIVVRIREARVANSNYSDVKNDYNYNIAYPLAYIKIIFTPYFTFNKFKIFSDTSLLLIWGAIINQIIIMLSFLGLIRSTRVNFYNLFFWIPFFIFLAFAAYISPWSGRLRDSFYPLIACYAAYFIQDYFIKPKKT